MPTYAVGQAPWETASTPQTGTQSFAVGSAPWESSATAAPTASAQPNTWGQALQNASNDVGKFFPGQEVGKDIGTAGYALYTKAKDLITGSHDYDNMDLSAPSPLQATGDVAQGALTVAAPGVGKGLGVAGRIAANATLGAGLGASNAVAQGENVGDVAKGAGTGALLGGVFSSASEALSGLMNNLPTWLTKIALPKLKTENVPYTLANTKIGSTNSMLNQSKTSLSNYEGQIQSILSHPEYSEVAADSPSILKDAVSQFPNSNYTTDDLINNAKTIAPKVGGLLDKFEAGQANVQEVNTIRKELDQATKSVYTSLNRPPETKALGAALANSMREFVKDTAPQTDSIFSNYAKEIDLQKALTAADKKTGGTISFKDLLAAGSGFAGGGLKGALEAIIAERLVTSPAVLTTGARAISSAAPVINTIARGIKAPIINSLQK